MYILFFIQRSGMYTDPDLNGQPATVNLCSPEQIFQSGLIWLESQLLSLCLAMKNSIAGQYIEHLKLEQEQWSEPSGLSKSDIVLKTILFYDEFYSLNYFPFHW